MKIDKIRNFSIIAHIDHGKSTLADRMLEFTQTVSKRDMKEQYLDSMDIERERGITIKSQAVRINYKGHRLHLIDTPGHVDFSYEVSRALTACEGALLVVDASQGIQAQTLANAYLAVDHDLVLIPVLNKIDLPGADIDKTTEELVGQIGFDPDSVIPASAKEGRGIEEVLDAIIERIPAPSGDPDKPLKALIFDSHYDSYKGVILYVRIFDGTVKKGDKIKLMSTGITHDVLETGIFQPVMHNIGELEAGDVGYIIAGIKTITDAKVGDTITSAAHPAEKALPGYREILPMVYCGMYPADNDKYPELREALEKLQLNDAALFFEPETSQALGFGFRVGFLGLLHMEVTQERLEREFNMNLVITTPSVVYKAYMKDGSHQEIHNPSQVDETRLDYLEEPYVNVEILLPSEYIGSVMKLCIDKRGVHKGMTYLTEERVMLKYDMPLSEIIFEFFDRLKSMTSGYASFDYQYCGHRKGELSKLSILINGEPVDALTVIVHKDQAYHRSTGVVRKLKENIPRQMFEVIIQAALGSKILTRSTVKPLRKNVTAKCYGGDVSRKRKLLDKQKEGKKRMKRVGKVEIPQEAFLSVLQVEDEK
ncbi:MAG TPA: elongation factor 4 [Firmicutes bacterium]|nr:elongation factor 4 [Bacillota bacterium]